MFAFLKSFILPHTDKPENCQRAEIEKSQCHDSRIPFTVVRQKCPIASAWNGMKCTGIPLLEQLFTITRVDYLLSSHCRGVHGWRDFGDARGDLNKVTFCNHKMT